MTLRPRVLCASLVSRKPRRLSSIGLPTPSNFCAGHTVVVVVAGPVDVVDEMTEVVVGATVVVVGATVVVVGSTAVVVVATVVVVEPVSFHRLYARFRSGRNSAVALRLPAVLG